MLYYFERLNPIEKLFYNKLLKAMKLLERQVVILGNVEDKLDNIMQAISYDHPELFYIDFFTLKYEISNINTVIHIKYLYSKSIIENRKQIFDESFKRLVTSVMNKEINNFSNPYSIEKCTHDYLASHISYNTCAVNFNELYPEAFTSFGALVNKSAVCEGIAKLYKLVLDYFNIENYMCHGIIINSINKTEEHIWNIVKLKTGFYHVDVTWDINNPVRYDYFNLDDFNIMKDHFDISILGYCNNMSENYFVVEKLLFKGKKKLIPFLSEKIKLGETVTFRIKRTDNTPNNVETIVYELIIEIIHCFGSSEITYKVYVNDKQLVYFIDTYQR